MNTEKYSKYTVSLILTYLVILTLSESCCVTWCTVSVLYRSVTWSVIDVTCGDVEIGYWSDFVTGT